MNNQKSGTAASPSPVQNRSRKGTLSLTTALCCLLLAAGCAFTPADPTTLPGTSNSTAVQGSSTPTVTTAPQHESQPTVPQGENYPTTEGRLLVDVFDEAFDASEEVPFQLPEFPGLQFLRSGATICVQRNSRWDEIISGYQIYLADLNDDGKPEFLATETSGSGIVDYRIYVYDLADDMRYCMHQRMVSDFDITIENGNLVVQRYAYMSIHSGNPPTDRGTLRIEDRQLYYVSNDEKIQGVVESTRFDSEFLQQAASDIQNSISRGMFFTVYRNDATNYYLDRHMDAIRPAMLEQEDGRFWLDSALVQDQDALQYLELICRLTYPYHVYGLPDRYLYLDPENPAQLFLCTELRDTGFDDIRAYYEALVAGTCQPHPDTYVMRLDEHTIYRWGESENLYDAIRIS